MSLSKIFVNNTQIVGVDNEPTAGSINLVESDGIYKKTSTIDALVGKDYSNDLLPGYAIKLGLYNIGDVVDVTPVENNRIGCLLIRITGLEDIRIKGTGGVYPRLYGLLDKDCKLLQVAPASATVRELTHINIKQAGYLVINMYIDPGYDHIIISTGDNMVNILQNTLDNVNIKQKSIINVNIYNGGNPLTLYTFETAIASIKQEDRCLGTMLIYRKTMTDVELAIYLRGGSGDVDWLNPNYWHIISTYPSEVPVTYGDTENLFVNAESWINKRTGNLEPTGVGGYRATNYLPIKPGLIVCSAEGGTAAKCAFYDSQFRFISSLVHEATNGNNVPSELTVDNIPENAVYMRCTSGNTNKPYIKGYDMADILFIIQQDVIAKASAEVKYGDANAVFSLLEQWINKNTGFAEDASSVPGYRATPFLPVKPGLMIYGTEGGIAAKCAFYDETFAFISCLEYPASGSNTLSTLTQNDIPSNAKYIRCSGRGTEAYIKEYTFSDMTEFCSSLSCHIITQTYKTSKWLAFGDSITQGYYSRIPPTPEDHPYALDATKSYAYICSKITGKTLINVAIGGTGVSFNHGSPGASGRELVDTLISDGTLDDTIDLITIAYGVNDWKYNCVLGSWDDPVTSTSENIIPSMRYFIERCIYAAPNAKIIVIMPINCRFGQESTNWGIGYPFSNNGTLELIYEKFKEICEYYGIEYIDMLHQSVVNRKNIGQCLLDNVHPSIPTHVAMARELSKKIMCY